jgi:hypothetical protein
MIKRQKVPALMEPIVSGDHLTPPSPSHPVSVCFLLVITVSPTLFFSLTSTFTPVHVSHGLWCFSLSIHPLILQVFLSVFVPSGFEVLCG